MVSNAETAQVANAEAELSRVQVAHLSKVAQIEEQAAANAEHLRTNLRVRGHIIGHARNNM